MNWSILTTINDAILDIEFFHHCFPFFFLLTVGPLELYYGKQLRWVEVHIQVYQMKIYFVFLRMDIGWTNRKIVPQTCNVTFLPDFNILPIHLLYIFLIRLFQNIHIAFFNNIEIEPFCVQINLKKSILKLIQIGDFSRRKCFFFITDIK